MTHTTPTLQLLVTDPILTHEETLVERVSEVARAAIRSGVFDYPVIVGRVRSDQGTDFVLLDGHHRLAAATTRLGLSRVPALVVEYFDDSRVTVQAWRNGEIVAKADVVRAAKSGQLMPIKSSRHNFEFKTSPCNVPLTALRGTLKFQTGA